MIENINLDKSQVSAELHGYMYDAIYRKTGVFDYGSNLGYELVSNNEITLKDGLILNYGRFMRVAGTQSITIANGVTGSTRYDLIVAHFETDGVNEVHDIRVLKGETDGTVPEFTQEDIYNGGSVHEMPLYSVYINGLNVESIVPMFNVINSLDFYRKTTTVNLFDSNLNNHTVNGLSFVNNNDGTYSINGTASANTEIILDFNFSLKKGTYKLLGCFIGGGTDTYMLRYHDDSWTLSVDDVGQGKTFELESDTTANVGIYIAQGYNCENLTFKPMFTTNLNASIDDFVSFKNSLIIGQTLDKKVSTSGGSDYGEVGTWNDGNPLKEDRLYRFLTIVGDNREVDIANSSSQIVGTSNLMENVGFLGNYTAGAEYDTSKVVISILGCSYVKTNDNTIIANDRVMSDDNGYAVKSSNNLGYRVLKVVEEGLLEIVVSPNTDMIQRIRTAILNYTVISNEKPTTYPCMWFKVVE